MRSFIIEPASCVKGEVSFLGDKSIAHRALIISALIPAQTRIYNFPANEDCMATVNVLEKLGVKINYGINKVKDKDSAITVFGVGLYGFKKPKRPLFINESGTTFRLIMGVLAGQSFEVTLRAGKSLSKRPMLRVTEPLRLMGARITALHPAPAVRKEDHPPITIRGGNLKPITYTIPVASAQVKSAILFSGLYAKGTTKVIERLKTRDHTERMLKLCDADIKITRNEIVIKGGRELTSPKKIYIPGDISSASFFIVLASVLRGSKILLKNVGLNPLRAGIIKVLRRMGADIRVSGIGVRFSGTGYRFSGDEPMGIIEVSNSSLKGAVIKKREIPSLIDELPILMVAACFAKGQTTFDGVEELRVKETDRIRSMVENLQKMGAVIKSIKGLKRREKIIIKGVGCLKGARVKSYGDHRTAMSLIVAALNAEGISEIDEIDCIKKSFPNFLSTLKEIILNNKD